jgi:ubiquinone biosynthesis accessory factor UbiJ
MTRLFLLVNHVLASEPAARARLEPHAHKTLKLELVDAPAWWPFAQAERVSITAAGLLEWVSEGGSAHDALVVRVSFARLQPGLLWAWVSGQGIDALQLQIEGDAPLAADVDWVARECRWDVEADLARLTGPLVARQLAQLARAVRAALHKVVAPAEPSVPAA